MHSRYAELQDELTQANRYQHGWGWLLGRDTNRYLWIYILKKLDVSDHLIIPRVCFSKQFQFSQKKKHLSFVFMIENSILFRLIYRESEVYFYVCSWYTLKTAQWEFFFNEKKMYNLFVKLVFKTCFDENWHACLYVYEN